VLDKAAGSLPGGLFAPGTLSVPVRTVNPRTRIVQRVIRIR